MILTSLHYLYIVMVVVILAIMLMKKDIVIPEVLLLLFSPYLVLLYMQAMNFGASS